MVLMRVCAFTVSLPWLCLNVCSYRCGQGGGAKYKNTIQTQTNMWNLKHKYCLFMFCKIPARRAFRDLVWICDSIWRRNAAELSGKGQRSIERAGFGPTAHVQKWNWRSMVYLRHFIPAAFVWKPGRYWMNGSPMTYP